MKKLSDIIFSVVFCPFLWYNIYRIYHKNTRDGDTTMLVYKEPFPKTDKPVASVALGTFDGLHGGHLAVITAAVKEAERLGGPSAVWCFASPPKNVFSPGSAEPLMTPEEKADAIAALGVDILIIPEPDAPLLSMDTDAFLRALTDALRPASVFCGYNFTFGKNALGTPDVLVSELLCRGVAVNVIPAVLTEDGVPVSSSLLRRRLAEKSADS